MADISALDGRALDEDVRLEVGELEPRSYAEQSHFTLLLQRAGRRSDRPIVHGLASAGRPSQGIPGWIDGFYGGLARFDGERYELTGSGIEAALFRSIGGLIRPGGWLGLAYETLGEDTEPLRETRRLLGLAVPPVVTPIGRLLYLAGCGLHIRDWYISEGWREGPRKLQGYRPSSRESLRDGLEETAASLVRFLEESEDEAELQAARARAHGILSELEAADPAGGAGPGA